MNQLPENLKNIVFDFGGVLVDLDFARCVDAFTKLGIDVGMVLNRYKQGGVFEGIEEGTSTIPEFCDEVRRLSEKHNITDKQIWGAWDKFLTGIPHERLDTLLRLKGQYHLFLLSNTNYIHWCRAQNDLFLYKGNTVDDFFERIFLSFEMHLQKPDPEIFKQMAEAAAIRPDETLFIDDMAENCATARQLGFHTFQPVVGGEWMKLFN